MNEKKKILVVDDEKKFTRMLSHFFRVKKYAMLTSLDGEEALEIIHQQRPDLVLLDIQLPKVNGLEVLREIKKNYSEIKVIVISGFEKDYRTMVQQLGVDGIYTKPVRLGELTSKIESLFYDDTIVVRDQADITNIQSLVSVNEMPLLTIPKAKLLFIEKMPLLAHYLQAYFSNEQMSLGKYQVICTNKWEEVKDLIISEKPDLLLVHLEGVDLEPFLNIVTHAKYPPKDIIVYGPFTEKQEITAIGFGAKVVEAHVTPIVEKHISQFLRKLSEKELKKLAKVVMTACMCHDLIETEKDQEKDLLYQRVQKIIRKESDQFTELLFPQLELDDVFDLLDKESFFMELEKEFAISISEDSYGCLHTVKDVVLYIAAFR